MSDEAPPPAPAMRRAPTRARGQQRVARILDAAEQLFAEAGYDHTTTNEIAARAATSIGSLYQFFPNKEAVLHAVAERYRAGLSAVYDDLLRDAASLPLEALVGRLVDATVQFGGEHIGFSRVVLQAQASPQLAGAAHALQQTILVRLDGLLAIRATRLGAEQRMLYASVALSAFNALLALLVNAKQAGNVAFAYQVKEQMPVLLVAYLRAVLHEEGEAGEKPEKSSAG